MKILHIIYDDIRNPWCGGGGALRASKVNEYLAPYNQVIVLTGNFPGARNENINGVDYIRIGFKSSYLFSRISFTLLIPFYIKKFKSDIVVNDASYFSPCFASLYTNRPIANIVHHIMGRHSFRLYPLLGLFPFTVEKIFMRIFKDIITPSKGIERDIRKRYAHKNIKAVPNGVSETLFHLKPEERRFILFLGRIDMYMKGLDILLASFARIKSRDIVLKIAGSGKRGDMRRLQRLISSSQLKGSVEFLGRVHEQEKLELLRTCLFVAMPSRFEGWGIVALEANAAGKAVLGTNIKGLSEAVEPGKTALLIEPEDVEGLASAMDMLIKKSDLRTALGRRGRIWAQEFSWESVSKAQVSFYESLLGK